MIDEKARAALSIISGLTAAGFAPNWAKDLAAAYREKCNELDNARMDYANCMLTFDEVKNTGDRAKQEYADLWRSTSKLQETDRAKIQSLQDALAEAKEECYLWQKSEKECHEAYKALSDDNEILRAKINRLWKYVSDDYPEAMDAK